MAKHPTILKREKRIIGMHQRIVISRITGMRTDPRTHHFPFSSLGDCWQIKTDATDPIRGAATSQ